jgi:hypothetical protein
MAATISDLVAADPSAIIHAVDDEEDNDMGFLPSDGNVSDEQWALLASFESLLRWSSSGPSDGRASSRRCAPTWQRSRGWSGITHGSTARTASWRRTSWRGKRRLRQRRGTKPATMPTWRQSRRRRWLARRWWRSRRAWRRRRRIDRENRELEEDIVARDEAFAAAARDRARYHTDLAAVTEEEVACAEAVEEQAHVAAEEELAASS